MDSCNDNYCNRKKDKDKDKEYCVSSFDDALQHVSCNIKRELIDNNRCIIGALTRSVLNTTTAFVNCKITQWFEQSVPKWATR